MFRLKSNRANIDELGIGCNPDAIISGNVLEDKKVGLHIAYGKSNHFKGGTVDSDVHQDIVYAKGCPIEATSVVLINQDDSKIQVVKNSEIQYNLVEK